MGRVPTINVDNMSRKATLALTNMAAKVENKNSSVPSEETIGIIDDVLGASSGIKFYGTTTKTYKNSRDELSGSFCTVPVRYEFKEKKHAAKLSIFSEKLAT
jgi:hypothetical protein